VRLSESLVLAGKRFHAQNARMGFQRHVEPACSVKLRHHIDISQAWLRAKSEPLVPDQGLDGGKPLPHPCGNPIRYILFRAAESLSQMVERTDIVQGMNIAAVIDATAHTFARLTGSGEPRAGTG
jgi:hypothetical protein